MSFTKANPSGWSTGDKLLSAQMNQLDTDHANSVDKTTAGDTISGVVTVAGASSGITIASTSTQGLKCNAGALIDNFGTIQCENGGAVNFLAGSTGSVLGTVSIGNGGQIAVAGGSTGKFQCNNGPSDVKFPATTRQISTGMVPYTLGTGWTIPSSNIRLTGPATTATQVLALPSLHQGSIVSAVVVCIKVLGAHANVPAVLPTIDIRRKRLTAAIESDVSLLSGGPAAFPTPGSGAAWDNGNVPQVWTGTLNQFNTIDNTQYCYYAVLVDENGANSVAGNTYLGMIVTCGTITSLALP